jgi:hypothetical protein
MAKAVFCIANSQEAAKDIVEKLKVMGFSGEDISVLFPDRSGTRDFAYEQHTKAPEGATAGGLVGASAGGALGWLAGLARCSRRLPAWRLAAQPAASSGRLSALAYRNLKRSVTRVSCGKATFLSQSTRKMRSSEIARRTCSRWPGRRTSPIQVNPQCHPAAGERTDGVARGSDQS